MKRSRLGAMMALGVLFALAFSHPAPALETVPAYNVTEIGSQLIAANPGVTYSTALAVNETGDAAGMAVVDGALAPFLYTPERGPILLPRLGVAAQAVDLTDRDFAGNILVVGTAYPDTPDRLQAAVLWIYSTTAGVVTEAREIGTLAGFANSVATAVNNHWIVVGYSTNFDFSGSPAMKYDVLGDFLAAFDFPVRPTDVNDFGDVTGGGFLGNLNGGFTDLGAPDGMSLPSLVAINDLGWTTGRAVTSLSDGSGRRISAAVRHLGPGGWHVITANSWQDTGTDINYFGDVVGTTGVDFAFRPLLYIGALDQWFLLDDLLAPGFQDRLVTRAEAINDLRQIAGSGTGGAVLLSPTDVLPPPPPPPLTPAPPPPADLVALAHDATASEPWTGIALSWSDTSDLETGFTVERSPAGAGAWEVIASNWPNPQYDDIAVEPRVTYDYRVNAVGTGGVSGYSNIASATAPSDPVSTSDTIAPTISILSPADGATVSGKLEVAIEATDNQALAYVEISTVIDSRERVVCSRSLSGETTYATTCRLNVRKLPAGAYPVNAFVSDGAGNTGTARITINVVAVGKVASAN